MMRIAILCQLHFKRLLTIYFGIILCEPINSDDPNALIGLSLIELTTLLNNIGLEGNKLGYCIINRFTGESVAVTITKLLQNLEKIFTIA